MVDSNKNINVKYLECDKTTGKLTLRIKYLFMYNIIEPILVTLEKNQLFLS